MFIEDMHSRSGGGGGGNEGGSGGSSSSVPKVKARPTSALVGHALLRPKIKARPGFLKTKQ